MSSDPSAEAPDEVSALKEKIELQRIALVRQRIRFTVIRGRLAACEAGGHELSIAEMGDWIAELQKMTSDVNELRVSETLQAIREAQDGRE